MKTTHTSTTGLLWRVVVSLVLSFDGQGRERMLRVDDQGHPHVRAATPYQGQRTARTAVVSTLATETRRRPRVRRVSVDLAYPAIDVPVSSSVFRSLSTKF